MEASRLDMLKGTVGDVRSGKNDDRRAKLDTRSTKGIAWLHLVERKPERVRERERERENHRVYRANDHEERSKQEYPVMGFILCFMHS